MTQFDDIVVTPVYGPLSTNNYPNIIPKMNLGVLNGIHPNPPKFYPADNSSEFSNARREYSRCATPSNNPNAIFAKNGGSCAGYSVERPKNLGFVSFLTGSSGKSQCISSCAGKSNKYISPQSSGQYVCARKRNAVGKSSFKQGLPEDAPLSYKNYNANDVKTALRIVRGGGCVAPAKKGSIYNRNTPGNGIFVSSTSSM